MKTHEQKRLAAIQIILMEDFWQFIRVGAMPDL